MPKIASIRPVLRLVPNAILSEHTDSLPSLIQLRITGKADSERIAAHEKIIAINHRARLILWFAQAARCKIAAIDHGLKGADFENFATDIGIDRSTAYDLVKLAPRCSKLLKRFEKEERWPSLPDALIEAKIRKMPYHLRRPLHDVVFTDPKLTKRLIAHFRPTGKLLDPCRGDAAFHKNMPADADWCEINEGRDFLRYDKLVDWIITNPPWSSTTYRPIARHAFRLSRNVVFLVRLYNALGTYARHDDFRKHRHGLKEIVVIPWKDAGMRSEGFVLCAIHWQRDWKGGTRWTHW